MKKHVYLLALCCLFGVHSALLSNESMIDEADLVTTATQDNYVIINGSSANIKYRQMPNAVCLTKGLCSKKDNGVCKCYCAFGGGPRDWQEDDVGIYVENDPLGHGCYCKQRDLDKARADNK